jgi:hypothetical protein
MLSRCSSLKIFLLSWLPVIFLIVNHKLKT